MSAVSVSLADFILQRVAEDEERARDAYYEGQVWAPEEEAVVSLDRDLEPVMYLDRKPDAWFAADWSPARVLAECEAKRRIVEFHKPLAVRAGYSPACEGCWEEGGMDGAPLYPCRTVKWVALPYSDHPDYRDEWRP